MNNINVYLINLLTEINDYNAKVTRKTRNGLQEGRANFLEKFKPIANQLGHLIKTLPERSVAHQTVLLAPGNLDGNHVSAKFIAFNNPGNATFSDEKELENILSDYPIITLMATLHSNGLRKKTKRDAKLNISLFIRGNYSLQVLKSSDDSLWEQLSIAASGLKYNSIAVPEYDTEVVNAPNFLECLQDTIESINLNPRWDFDGLRISFEIDENDSEQAISGAINAIISSYCEVTFLEYEARELVGIQ